MTLRKIQLNAYIYSAKKKKKKMGELGFGLRPGRLHATTNHIDELDSYLDRDLLLPSPSPSAFCNFIMVSGSLL